MSITEVLHIKSEPIDPNWKPYDVSSSTHTKSPLNHPKSSASSISFVNRSAIRKAKMTQVVYELKTRGLATSGSAEERRTRLMDHLFPKGTIHSQTAN